MNNLDTIAFFCRSFINRETNLPIRSSDMGLLILISEMNLITPLDASLFFGVSKPMIAAMVKRLSNHALIAKKSDQSDKRSYQLHLTSKGECLVNNSKATYVAFVENLKKDMGSKNFNALMSSIKRANKAIRRIT